VAKFVVRATTVVFGNEIVVFGNEIEVLGDNFVLLNAPLEHALCGDCQNIGEGVIMVVIPVAQLL